MTNRRGCTSFPFADLVPDLAAGRSVSRRSWPPHRALVGPCGNLTESVAAELGVHDGVHDWYLVAEVSAELSGAGTPEAPFEIGNMAALVADRTPRATG